MKVAERLTQDGEEYIVTRITVNKGRLQIDAIAATEAERRRDNLTKLLAGEAQDV